MVLVISGKLKYVALFKAPSGVSRAHPPKSESNTLQCWKKLDWEIKQMETQEWR